MTRASVELFLGGDVMLGRGIDPVLPNPGDPQFHEHYVRSAKDYVALAERSDRADSEGLRVFLRLGRCLSRVGEAADRRSHRQSRDQHNDVRGTLAEGHQLPEALSR